MKFAPYYSKQKRRQVNGDALHLVSRDLDQMLWSQT